MGDKTIYVTADNKAAEVNIQMNIGCPECGSMKFKFQTEKVGIAGDVAIDSPYADNNLAVLGLDCVGCGFGYSFNIKVR